MQRAPVKRCRETEARTTRRRSAVAPTEGAVVSGVDSVVVVVATTALASWNASSKRTNQEDPVKLDQVRVFHQSINYLLRSCLSNIFRELCLQQTVGIRTFDRTELPTRVTTMVSTCFQVPSLSKAMSTTYYFVCFRRTQQEATANGGLLQLRTM